MKTFLVPYVSTLISMLLMDAVWLNLMVNTFYKTRIGHLMGTISFAPAVVFYLLYAAGVLLLAVRPAIENKFSLGMTFAYGALLGLIAYGTYDLTSQATLKNWPLSLTIVDMIWGAILTGTVTLIATVAARSI